MPKYEKGSIGHLLELAKKDGFDNLKDWNEWKKAKKDGFDNVQEWKEWKNKKDKRELKYHPCSKEFQEDAKRLGLSGNQYLQKLIEEGKIVNSTKINMERWKDFLDREEYDSIKKYQDMCAQRRGYKDSSESKKEWRWKKGIRSPISEDGSWNVYLGTMAEKWTKKILELKFGGIEKEMPPNNPGYEFITKEGYRIDSKARTLSTNNIWSFKIDYNNITDYFLLWGFEYREGLVLLHVWLFHKEDMIDGIKFWRRDSFNITNDPKVISIFEKYEIKNELEDIKKEIEKDGEL